MDHLNKYQKMLLGIAVGDAFGVGYEMQPRWKILKYFTINKYSRRNKSKLGKYTDDTQMSIAIAELLSSNEKFTIENLANKFVEVYKRDPHSGYTRTFTSILKSVKNGKELLKIIDGNSSKNGAAMRAVPIGIIPDIKKVIEYAIINAKVTHDSPKGITSSVCIAVASHYFFHNLGKAENVFDFCIKACRDLDKESLEYFWEVKNMKYLNPELLFGRKDMRFGVPCDGMRTAGAVLYLISRFSDSPKQTLIESILLGGDTDSIASISLGIVLSNNTNIDEIPIALIKGLENDRYGRKYLKQLGNDLVKRFN